MSRCNVDFFDSQMNYIYHDTIDSPDIDLDYLTPEATSFDISRVDIIPVKAFVRFENHDNYIAVVDRVDVKSDYTSISVKPFSSLFDQSVLFDVNWQYGVVSGDTNAKSLENCIADLINQYWMNSDDEEQNIPLNLLTTSSTTNWSFGLVGDKADDDDASSTNNHQTIVEFYDVILQNALTRYRVSVEPKLNMENRSIDVYIGAPSETSIIETGLKEVNVMEFTIGRLEADTNKLEIWNEENYSDKIYYYLHTDGTYDTDGTTNRITPIKMEVIAVEPERDGNNAITKSFSDCAKEQADQKFGDMKWRNYIELDVGIENIFKANDMKIGQFVNIYHQGKIYETILTGKKIGDVLTLIFGIIRADLTKKLQLESSIEYTSAKSVISNSSTSTNK